MGSGGGTINSMKGKDEILTPEEREQLRNIMKKRAKALGSKGGKARMNALTPEERSEMGKKGMRSRWGDRPRCPCGQMTLARAKARGHKCSSA